MSDAVERLGAAIRSSQVLRLLGVGILVLVLQIPVQMISRLVVERRERRQAAVTEVASKWGNTQFLTGPVLIVPYVHSWSSTSSTGLREVHTEDRSATFLPDQLRIRGKIDSEVRSRGIFSVPVYDLGLDVEGVFAAPSFADLGIDPSTIRWDRVHIASGISDVRAIQQETSVAWNGKNAAFSAGSGDFIDGGPGIHAVLGMTEAPSGIAFSFPLLLHGSVGLFFSPFARHTTVELRSDSRHPSFQGNWLPAEREITTTGFTAKWNIPSLGRNFPQSWTSENRMREAIEGSRFGVELVDPIDPYRMSDRSVKYAGLFILLTFVTLWLLEVLAGACVHPIQYLLLGAALCLFYLLELSLSEHLGFAAAYALASASVVSMVAAYSWAILRRPRPTLVVASGVVVLYSYLYVLLTNEDYALLIGSIGLFGIVGIVMFVTRRVDWFGVGARPSTAPTTT